MNDTGGTLFSVLDIFYHWAAVILFSHVLGVGFDQSNLVEKRASSLLPRSERTTCVTRMTSEKPSCCGYRSSFSLSMRSWDYGGTISGESITGITTASIINAMKTITVSTA